jgi:hypothetical protein
LSKIVACFFLLLPKYQPSCYYLFFLKKEKGEFGEQPKNGL